MVGKPCVIEGVEIVMPRKREVTLCGQDDEADRKAVEALVESSSDATKTAERLVAYLEEFMKSQPPEREPATIFELFIGRLSRDLQPSTLKTYVDVINDFGIFPGNCDSARQRIRRTRLMNGIKRRNNETGIPERTNATDLESLQLLVTTALPGDTARDVEYRALMYVQAATGGRPDNIMKIIDVRLEAHGLLVKWGRRKVRGPSRAHLTYEYAWSFPPPADISRRLQGLGTEPWMFRSSSNVASATCSWLRRRCGLIKLDKRITSTSGRPRLSTILYRLYESGLMNTERFVDLMDHEPSMSRQRYQDLL